MSAKKAGKVPLAHKIPTTAVPTLATTAGPVSMGITGTGASVRLDLLDPIVGSILMNVSRLPAPLAPPA